MAAGDLTMGPEDYLLFDAQEAITFTSRRPEGDTTAAVPNAVGLVYQEREAAMSGGLFDVGDCAWHIPAEQLGGLVPREGDTVTQADGTTWVAHGQGCNLIALRSAYRLVCYRSKKQLPL